MKTILANLLLIVVSVFLTAFLVNAALVIRTVTHHNFDAQRLAAARRSGVPFDPRSEYKAFTDLRKTDPNVYPADFPQEYLQEQAASSSAPKPFFPLSGIANTTQIYCNEDGAFLIFHSDRHGFNNNDAVYNQPGSPVMIIGDSFAEGACVKQDENIAADLNRKGVKTISIGMGGNGPLTELAALREYGDIIKPRKIIWLYYAGNDLDDLKNEMANPILKKYLDDKQFKLNMASRQEEVDQFWKARTERLIKERRFTYDYVDSVRAIISHVPWKDVMELQILQGKLEQLGELVHTRIPNAQLAASLDNDTAIKNNLGAVMSEARDYAATRGAQLYFVYLPSFGELSSYSPDRDAVLAKVRAQGIPVIDFYSVLKGTPDPESYFPFKIWSHYTPAGYAFLADHIYNDANLATANAGAK